MICNESVSNLLPISRAISSLVRNFVMTRFTGVCLPLCSIRTMDNKLVPFFISYLPGLMFFHRFILLASQLNVVLLVMILFLFKESSTASFVAALQRMYRN